MCKYMETIITNDDTILLNYSGDYICFNIKNTLNFTHTLYLMCLKWFWRGTQQRRWLRHYATTWKVEGSISDELIGFFISLNTSSHTIYGSWVDSASNRNEYHESSWG
jgi:hypothetical protein